MIVIADTSPINYLALIGAIDVLSALYEKVAIPQAVFEELQVEETPEEVRAWVANLPDWFTVLQVSVFVDTDLSELDKGEKEAILLCQESNADALIIDDRLGREEAIKRGISIVGTLGVLNSAAEKELLDFSEAISKLRQTSFRASEKLIAELLQFDAERKQTKK